MGRVRAGTIGILPAGALGVSFFYHLTRELTQNDGSVFFVERPGSGSAAALKATGQLRISAATRLHHLSMANLSHGTLLDQFGSQALPEVLLLGPNPDQLPGVLQGIVQLLQCLNDCHELTDAIDLPIVVLASNGIYYQRLRQQFIEQLEEATLLGRLPDLWPDLMPRIVGRLLRGVTIQTGIRDGDGSAAVYEPGPRGITRLAGGDKTVRERVATLLQERGGWFELAPNSSATRLEFDKAIVNLTANLLGQFYALDSAGRFIPLRVREIVTAEHEAEIRELAQHVFEVGQAVRAYGADEDFEQVFAGLMQTTHQHDDHIPSSLQWIGLRLRQGKLEPRLTPTEQWLLAPLIRYAHAAGLHGTGEYFERLKQRAMTNLATAAQASVAQNNPESTSAKGQ